MTPPSVEGGGPRAAEGLLGRVGRTAYRRRRTVLAAWLAGLVAVLALSRAFGGEFTADYAAPGSDSQRAQHLLEERFASQSGSVVTVVVRADDGVRAVRGAVGELLTDLRAAEHVSRVEDPYATPGAIDADGRTLVTEVRLDVANGADMPVEDTTRLMDIAREHSTSGTRVFLGGQAVATAEGGPVGSEAIGLAVAAVILLLTFGSVVAAGLPLVVALAGLAVSAFATGLVIRLVDAPEWSTSLAAMLGIGIGIDYVLLMVTRFREARAAGLAPEDATAATMDTAGRSVLVAGVTVVVSLLGLFAMGLAYMRGAALVAIVGVLVVLAASATLFPALLGFLGGRVDRLRLPLPRRRSGTPPVDGDGHVRPGRGWLWWSGLVQRHRIAAAVAGTAVMLALAAPFAGVRFGFPDAGNNPADSMTRQTYDAVADGFGPGANAPLLLVVQLPERGDDAVLAPLRSAAADTAGVASVQAPLVNPAGDTAVLRVVPATGPQDEATGDLVGRLRDRTVPDVTDGTGARVYVGGASAASIDSTDDLAGRIPYLITGVIVLSMLLLLAAFRSVVVPLKAALMNLLSVAAAYGVVSLVLQGGWAGRLVGIDTPTPLPPFVTVLMFAVLFGLSMDYEVFLLSRVRESWLRTGDSARSVTEGLAGTGRVITAAAAIMVAVFLAFVPSTEIVLKLIGVGMASAILLDATVVRMVLVPATMHLLGRRNWWMPRWLDRWLPELHIEGRPEQRVGPGPTDLTGRPGPADRSIRSGGSDRSAPDGDGPASREPGTEIASGPAAQRG
ncbi:MULTISPECIES: MMPL family transporter [unclassified Streptomyces]|uniref:MMPL family transporter n=1 Tax=unclassified Streptomyces TaxID=2593676 RepID=UPI0037FD93C6